MSHAESTTNTTLRFIDSWRNQNPNRLTAELLSLTQETNRRPDTYHFEVRNGVLTDQETGKAILDFILPGIEYGVAEKLQSWAKENDSGIAFWVSPRKHGEYPCEKIILHRIAYTLEGKKVILNSAVLFDAKLKNPESLRQKLFTTEDKEETIFKILAWLEKVSGQKTENKNNPEIINRAVYFAEKIQSGHSPHSIVEEMQKSGFLGQNAISCGGIISQSFSNLVLGKSEISIMSSTESWHSGVCRICHASTLVGPCSICSLCEKKF